jgi:hypothetical protein
MNNPNNTNGGTLAQIINVAIAICVAAIQATANAEEISNPKPIAPHVRDNIRVVVVRTPQGMPNAEVQIIAKNYAGEVRRRNAREEAEAVFEELAGFGGDGRATLLAAPFAGAFYLGHLAKTPRAEDVAEYTELFETDREILMRAVQEIDAQEGFARAFTDVAQKQGGRRLRVLWKSESGFVKASASSATMVENVVESIRLEHVKKDLLCLVMEVRTRMTMETGEVIYGEASRYRSDSATLSDWAFNDGEPMKTQFARACEQISLRVARQTLPRGAAAEPVLENSKMASGFFVIDSAPLAARDLSGLGRVGLISTSAAPAIIFQRPMTKEQAMALPRQTLDEGLKPLEDLQTRWTAAAVLSIPLSVAGQVFGGVKGLSEKSFKDANESLSSVTREIKHQTILRERMLTAAAGSLVEVKKPFPAGEEEAFRQMSCVMAGTLAWLPNGQTAQYYLQSEGVDTVLELEIVHPALIGVGNGEVNPPMVFSSRVRASVWSVQSGEELGFCEMQYRSPEYHFTAWAKDDAELLRSEVSKFMDATCAAVMQQMAIPSWRNEPAAILASNDGTSKK